MNDKEKLEEDDSLIIALTIIAHIVIHLVLAD